MSRMDRMIIVHLWGMRVKRNSKDKARARKYSLTYMVSGNRVLTLWAMRQPGEKWLSESYTPIGRGQGMDRMHTCAVY